MTDLDFDTQTMEDLKQAIMARRERKYPTKNRVLKFLSSTTQKNDQSLNEYFRASHPQAQESGQHSGDWSSHDIEALILMSGKRDQRQHSELLYEH